MELLGYYSLIVLYVWRNCLVFPSYVVKISDSGSVRATYNCDYYTTLDGSRLPIRWMAWESLILVS
jgi:discoidin domain receptor family protein 2